MVPIMRVEDSTRPAQWTYDIREPPWDEVQVAIEAMDGSTRSIVMLCVTPDYEELMGIGGGKHGLRCCFIVDSVGDLLLVDPEAGSKDVVTFLMGQISARPRDQLLPLGPILTAAKSYYDHAEPAPDLTWK